MKKVLLIIMTTACLSGFGQVSEFTFYDTTFEEGSICIMPTMQYSTCDRYGDGMKSENKCLIDSILFFLSNNPTVMIEIANHTDQRGTEDANLMLSQHRADQIKSILVEQGANADQLVSKGYGESELIYSDVDIYNANTKEEKEKLYQINRRLELRYLGELK